MAERRQELLSVSGVAKGFPGVQALKGVSFEVRAGEVHGLIGGNGAGKSTFMNILGGLLQKDTGSIRIDGKEVEIRTPKEAKELGIAFIHQELKLFPYLSVAENICIPDLPTKKFPGYVDEAEKHGRAKRMLETVGLKLDPRARLEDLSIAEQQLVEIAKALSGKTRILILDEPTSSLTDKEIRKLFEVVRGLKTQRVGIIFISHKLEEIFKICDRVTVLRDGRNVGTKPIGELSEDEIVQMMIGKQLEQYFPAGHAPNRERKLAEVKNLGNAKIKDVNLTIHEGEILGLFGLIGAGRSELARAIFGLDPVQAGEVRLDGELLRIKKPRQAIRRGIAFLTENRRAEGIIPDMNIRENVSMTILARISRGFAISRRRDRSAVAEALRSFRIVCSGPEQSVKTLSGGNQQKVVLAKWMATDVRLLILDEPTRGVDVGAKAEIYDLMAKMAHEQKIGILFISSEAPEILGMSHHILVMRSGAVAGEFAREEATQEKLLACAMGGGAR